MNGSRNTWGGDSEQRWSSTPTQYVQVIDDVGCAASPWHRGSDLVLWQAAGDLGAMREGEGRQFCGLAKGGLDIYG